LLQKKDSTKKNKKLFLIFYIILALSFIILIIDIIFYLLNPTVKDKTDLQINFGGEQTDDQNFNPNLN